jgi:hypothetical protein
LFFLSAVFIIPCPLIIPWIAAKVKNFFIITPFFRRSPLGIFGCAVALLCHILTFGRTSGARPRAQARSQKNTPLRGLRVAIWQTVVIALRRCWAYFFELRLVWCLPEFTHPTRSEEKKNRWARRRSRPACFFCSQLLTPLPLTARAERM